MNQQQTRRSNQERAWIWVLFQEKLERYRKNEEANAPRAPLNALEEKAAQALALVTERGAWKLKDKFKGTTLTAYYSELKKLTPTGWKTAISILWPTYSEIVGEKPKEEKKL